MYTAISVRKNVLKVVVKLFDNHVTTSEVAILTTKVTHVMMDPIKSCFHAVESDSENYSGQTESDTSKVLRFHLLAGTISLIS